MSKRRSCCAAPFCDRLFLQAIEVSRAVPVSPSCGRHSCTEPPSGRAAATVQDASDSVHTTQLRATPNQSEASDLSASLQPPPQCSPVPQSPHAYRACFLVLHRPRLMRLNLSRRRSRCACPWDVAAENQTPAFYFGPACPVRQSSHTTPPVDRESRYKPPRTPPQSCSAPAAQPRADPVQSPNPPDHPSSPSRTPQASRPPQFPRGSYPLQSRWREDAGYQSRSTEYLPPQSCPQLSEQPLAPPGIQ